MKDQNHYEESLLIGRNIRLRAVEPADIDIIMEYENDREIWSVSNTLMPYSRYEIETYVLNAQRDIFATKQLRLMIDVVSPTDAGTYTIGTIDLFDFDPLNLRAGIGIMLNKKHRNQGYAREAIQLLLNYGHAVLHLHQLYCNISETNETSIHLFESMGFVLCGTKKEWINCGEKWLAENTYQYLFE